METNFKIETESLVKGENITKYVFWNTRVGKIYQGCGDIEWDLIRDSVESINKMHNPFIYNNTLKTHEPYREDVPALTWSGYIYTESGKAWRRVAALFSLNDDSYPLEVWTDWTDTKYTGEPVEHFTISDGGMRND